MHQAQGICVLLNQHILQHYKWQLEPNSSGRWPKPYFNIEAWQGQTLLFSCEGWSANIFNLI